MTANIIIRKAATLAIVAGAAAAVLAGAFADAGAASKQKEAEKAYQEARKALNEEEYRDAAEQFAEIYKQYSDTRYAAKALYWQAFSQYKLGGKSELKKAQRALEIHLEKYSDTSTREDAIELYYRVLTQLANMGDRNAAEKLAKDTEQTLKPEPRRERDVDMEEKIAALIALQQMRSEKTLPIIEQIMMDKSEENAELREKALFVLSQYESEEAADILIRVAREDPEPEVRKNAVFWLSQTRSDKAAEFLEELLTDSDDPEMQEKVIFALSQIGDDRALAALRRIAVDKTQPVSSRANAIFWLGQSGGLKDITFVKELYGTLEDADLKEKVIFSVAQGSRHGAWLLELVNDPNEPTEVRKQALFWAGQSNAIDVDGLAEVYRKSKDREMREQAIFALSQRPEKKAVKVMIELARQEKDPEMRKQLVFWIGQSGDPDAEEFLLEIINN